MRRRMVIQGSTNAGTRIVYLQWSTRNASRTTFRPPPRFGAVLDSGRTAVAAFATAASIAAAAADLAVIAVFAGTRGTGRARVAHIARVGADAPSGRFRRMPRS